MWKKVKAWMMVYTPEQWAEIRAKEAMKDRPVGPIGRSVLFDLRSLGRGLTDLGGCVGGLVYVSVFIVLIVVAFVGLVKAVKFAWNF